jgi:hypothetical protein
MEKVIKWVPLSIVDNGTHFFWLDIMMTIKKVYDMLLSREKLKYFLISNKLLNFNKWRKTNQYE